MRLRLADCVFKEHTVWLMLPGYINENTDSQSVFKEHSEPRLPVWYRLGVAVFKEHSEAQMPRLCLRSTVRPRLPVCV